MGKPSDRAQVGRAVDPDGFAELVKASEPALKRLVRRICGRTADVDDLVQETYLRAWRGLGRFRGESSPGTWMTRIAVNVSRSWIRARRPSEPLAESAIPEVTDRASVCEGQLEAAYARALEQLTPDQRAVFLLHEADGLSYEQIAVKLRCPVGTVMSRLHRARARLIEALSERFEEFLP